MVGIGRRAWVAIADNEEWECAAYDADGRRYPWGDEPDSMRVNSHEGGWGTTTPVGRYAEHGDASPYGVHDLLGNVWECAFRYGNEAPRRHPATRLPSCREAQSMVAYPSEKESGPRDA